MKFKLLSLLPRILIPVNSSLEMTNLSTEKLNTKTASFLQRIDSIISSKKSLSRLLVPNHSSEIDQGSLSRLLTPSPPTMHHCSAIAQGSLSRLITTSHSPSPLCSYYAQRSKFSFSTRSSLDLKAQLSPMHTCPSPSLLTHHRTLRNLVSSHNYSSYRSFPKFKSRGPTRPDEALDVDTLDKHFAKEVEITETEPDGVVLEMKYFACHSDRPDSIKPNFRVHSLRTSFVKDGKVHNLINKMSKSAMKSKLCAAEKTIKEDLASHKVAEEDLKKIWWDDGGDEMEFWSRSLIKHSWLSKTKSIPNFASTTASLGMQVLDGSDENDLRIFLQKKKFWVGKYYKVSDLQKALKEYFKAEVYPTFIGVGSHHPCLYEIGVLHDKVTGKVIDHPMAKYVPQGEFLMRDI